MSELMERCSPDVARTLQAIYCRTLALAGIDPEDNILDVGGHSLPILSIVNCIQRELDVEISVGDVFENPTIAALARVLQLRKAADTRTAIRHALIPFRKIPDCRPAAAGAPNPEQAIAPASYAQERLWLIDQVDGGSAAYNLSVALRWSLGLNSDALRQAFETVVLRHEVLRTHFDHQGGQLLQVIRAQPRLGWGCVDLQASSAESEFPEALSQHLESFAIAPFDLHTGPLLRCHVYTLGPQDHVLQFVVHHSVFDGWSHGVFMGELLRAYRALEGGYAMDLPPPPLQYRDFARWQRENLNGKGLTDLQAYWEQQLAQLPQRLELPTDRVRPAAQTFRGETVHAAFPKDLLDGLRGTGRHCGATLFMTLLAAFAVLLYRYSGQRDFAIGTPVAGRDQPELQGLIGLFVNMLVLRCRIDPQMAFTGFLQYVKDVALGAYQHQQMPFERLVERLNPERSLSHSPLFQVMLALQSFPLEEPPAPGVPLASVPHRLAAAKFDLSLEMTETAAGLHCALEYATDLFEKNTALRMLARFQVLLAAVAVNPQARLSELPWFSPQERHQVLYEWNCTVSDYRIDGCLADYFERRAAEQPEAVAVRDEERRWTYAQLDQWGNRLARYLQGHASSGAKVALYAERGVGVVAGLLGILKSGMVYVPIDPKFPAARAELILRDSDARVLLTQRSLEQDCTAMLNIVVHCLDEHVMGPLNYDATAPVRRVEGGDCAYVIYTSGSTGRPKGVAVSHESVLNSLSFLESRYPMAAGDVFLFKTSIAFDISLTELLCWFMGRGSVAILPPGSESLPEVIADHVLRHEVTHINFAPSFLPAFLDFIHASPSFRQSSRLKYVMMGAEELPKTLVGPAIKALAPASLENLYGPTEAAIYAASFTCETPINSSRTPIGRPIANTQLYVLDSGREPVPVGIPGELYIGGRGLALGYLEQPQLTAERFMIEAWPGSGRLYRTGDRARWLPQGAIEYLGRDDAQVKLRGNRVELGEIEAQLRSCEVIQEAAVLLRTEGNRPPQLVAYLVPDAAQGLLLGLGSPHGPAARTWATHVRQFLQQRLPDYMVPGRYQWLDRFPVTHSGKIDRGLLASVALDSQTLRESAVAGTAAEKILYGIWQEALGLNSLGLRDNFFASGGDSILAIQVATLARKQGIAITPRHLFQHQTIAELAECAETLSDQPTQQNCTEGVVLLPIQQQFLRGEQGIAQGDSSAVVGLAPSHFPLARLTQQELNHWLRLYPRLQDLYPMTALQLGLLFHSRLGGSEDTYANQIWWTIEGDFAISVFKRAWSEVIARHPILRTAMVAMDREKPLQLVVKDVNPPWRELDLRECSMAERDARLESYQRADKQQGFDFARPALMRFSLFREEAARHRFVWTYHHSLLDGWSVGLLWREVLVSYAALSAETQVSLPAALPYSLYIAWLARQDTRSASRYWQRELAAVERATRLSIEQPGGSSGSVSAARMHFELDPKRSMLLQQLARTQQVTVFTIVQAAWSCLLADYSGSSQVVFGTTVSGRAIDLPGVEGIAGLFINTIPVRVLIDKRLPFGQWVRGLQEAQVEREAHSHLALSEIQRLSPLGPAHALFDNLLIYENYPVKASPVALQARIIDSAYEEQTHYALSVLVMPHERLELHVGFDTRRYQASDISILAKRFLRILERMCVNGAHSSVQELYAPLPPTDSRTEIDSTHSSLSIVTRQGDLRLGRYLIHQLIENQAQATPDSTALRCHDREYSYAALNAAANRVAHYLLAQAPALHADSLVAVLLPRTDLLVLTFLGIWKAGAAYIPIDPGMPAARLYTMLQGSQRPLLITDRQHETAHPWEDWGIRVMTLEAALERGHQDTNNPDVHVSGNDLSYVIFTSGSTGTPKGAMVEHIGVLNNLVNKAIDLRIDANSRVAQTASQSFDISVWQMFIALTRGGCTSVCDDRLINDVGRFIQWLREEGITVVEMVPSYLSLLMEYLEEHPGLELPQALQYLVLTGETADAGAVRKWFGLFPQTGVMNAYGPTEASDDITHHMLSPMDEIANPLPVGRALANFDLYVVDEQLSPVCTGTVGEIVVSGIGVGRGYLNLPAATAQAFLTSPFPDRYRSRLYRTGDMGELRADGVLLFHGRKDRQVKVRGFRIELEEVELKILETGCVRQAVVLDISLAGSSTFICAFVVPQRDTDKDAIVRRLQQELPSYMVPTEFRLLAALPLLDNGKIDRRKLREQYQSPAREVAYRKPETQIEIRLARLWGDVLGVDCPGLDDDFFDVGGDSFKAIRIAAKYGAPLEVLSIYNLRTIGTLAAELERTRGRTERRIVPVSVPDAVVRVAVLAIANSGGGPVGFVETGRALRAVSEQIALYAVNLPRSSVEDEHTTLAEVDRLTQEICTCICDEIDVPLVLFAQCNGSALAISIAQSLQRSSVPPRAICIGGALLRTQMTPKDSRSDREVIEFLTAIDASLPGQADELALFLNDFRYDCALADCYYNAVVAKLASGGLTKVAAPLFCIVGTEDPLVSGYQRKFRDWEHLSEHVSLLELAGHGHYLLRDCPGELAFALAEICQSVGPL